MTKNFLLLLLAAMFLPGASEAKDWFFDFRPRSERTGTASADVGSGARAARIVSSPSAAEAATADFSVGDLLSVRLFAEEPIRIRLKERTPGIGETASFLGTIDESGGILDSVIVQDGNGIQIDVQDYRNGRIYTVFSTDGEVRVAERDAAEGARTCRTIEPPVPDGWSEPDVLPQEKAAAASARNPVYVDVLVAYDSTAVSWLASEGGSLESFANVAVQKMNTAIANTDLDSGFRFRLVGTMETGSSALGSLQGALYAASGRAVSVNGTRLSWPSVKDRRNELGADVVCVLIDTGSETGTVGLGYSMTESNRSYFADSTFNACAIRSVASSHTMTHEVGHNMGAGHTDMAADASTRWPQLFSYSSGYYFTAGGRSYHTIMAYNSDGYGNYYTEAPYFSSPLHAHEGTTVGNSTHDNTRTLAATFAEVAAYRNATIPEGPPSVPTGVAASGGTFEDKVRVSWNHSSGATSYTVYRSTSSSGAKSTLGTTSSTSWDDTTATPETTYWYWVKASNTAGASGYSASASGFCTRLTDRSIAEALDATQFTWTTSETHPWDYTQEVSSDGEDSAQSGGIAGHDTTWIQTTVVGPASVSFKYRKNFYSARFFVTVDGSEGYSDSTNAHSDSTWRTVSFSIGSGTHTIRISYTHNGTGYSYEHNGVWVDRFQAVGGSAPTPPSAPSWVEASDGDYTDKVHVEWATSSGATSYTVYRATSSSGTKSTLGSTASTSWNDTTATAGTTYYYWVKASNSAGASGYSDYDTGYRASAPSRPGNDDFANASSISGSSGSTSGSNVDATSEYDEWADDSNARGSVWWTWTAPSTGVVRFSTEGSDFDTILSVYRGNSYDRMWTVATDDDHGDGRTSVVSFRATAGTTYHVAVYGYDSSRGNFSLSWQSGFAAVHRFYSSSYKGHFFTIDEDEMWTIRLTNPNWRYEGVAYLARPSRAEGTTPVYRFYSKRYRGHFFTINEDEMWTIRRTNPNWRYEGIAFYVYPDSSRGGNPVYRFWSKGYRHHFFTTDEEEMWNIRDTNPNWKFEGVAYFAASPGYYSDIGDDSSFVKSEERGVNPTARAIAAWSAIDGTHTQSMANDSGEDPEIDAQREPSGLLDSKPGESECEAEIDKAAGEVSQEWSDSDAAPWALLIWPDRKPVSPDGKTEVGGIAMETCAEAPDDMGMVPFEDVVPVLALSLRLTLPEGTWKAMLWSAAYGTLDETEAEGALTFTLPISGVWHWLRVRDAEGDGEDAFSLWLRAEGK